MTATESEMAWAAGLFEGEGCACVMKAITRVGRQKRMYLGLVINMTDEDVLRKFHSIVGVGTIHGPWKKGGNNCKPVWRWRVSGKKAVELVTSDYFFGWLCSRRRALILEIMEMVENQPPLEKRNSDKTHCPRGHEYEFLTNRHGERRCRECNRIRSRDYQRRKRAEVRAERDRLVIEMLQSL